MPSEYEALVAALKLTNVPFAEYGWKNRPEGAYGVVSLEMEAGQLNGDGTRLDRVWEGSVDLFYPRLSDRSDLIEEIEETLTEICGSSWELNSTQYENATGLFHAEWVFQVMDTAPPIFEVTATVTLPKGTYVKGQGVGYYKPASEIWPSWMTAEVIGGGIADNLTAAVYPALTPVQIPHIAVTANTGFTLSKATDVQVRYACEMAQGGGGA